MSIIPELKQKLLHQYANLEFDPAAAFTELRLNTFTNETIPKW